MLSSPYYAKNYAGIIDSGLMSLAQVTQCLPGYSQRRLR